VRIFYFCPDFDQPSGGIKQIYEHVELLCENGYDAYVVHLKEGFRPQWVSSLVPIIYFSQAPSLYPDDAIVIPEGLPDVMKSFKSLCCQKVVIALSTLFIFQKMPLGENWKDYDIQWAMAGSKVIEDFVRDSMGIDNIYSIAISIDHDLFYYAEDLKKQQAAYMVRKDSCSPMVEKIVKSRDPSLNELEFVKIENLTIDDYAQQLRQSDIFLTTSLAEGIHKSVLEAMACGCICIGFDGIGPREYIIDSGDRQNFICAESANFIDLAEKFAAVVEMMKRNDPKIEVIRQNAISTAGRYCPELEKKTVLQFWENYLQAHSLPVDSLDQLG